MNNRMRHFIVKLMCDELGCKDISEIAGFAFYKETDVPIMPEPVSGADGYVYDGMVLPKHKMDDEFRYAIMYGSGSVRLYVSAYPIGCDDYSSTYSTYALVHPPYRVYTYDRATNSWGAYTETAEGSDYSLNLLYAMWSNQNIIKSDGSIAFEGTTPKAFYLNRANTPTAFLYGSGRLQFRSSSVPDGVGWETVGVYVDWESQQYPGSRRVPWLRIDKSLIESVEIAADAIPAHTDYWFYGCSNLRHKTLPEGLTEIGKYMFYNTNLYSYTSLFPSTLEEIGEYAFANMVGPGVIGSIDRREIVIPDAVKKIGTRAFYNAGISNAERCYVVIGSGCEEIGSYAFANNGGMHNVTMGAAVKRIHPYAFYRVGTSRAGVSTISDSWPTITFRNTSGWWVSTNADAASGTTVNVSDTKENAKMIATYSYGGIYSYTMEDGKYVSYYWNRT